MPIPFWALKYGAIAIVLGAIVWTIHQGIKTHDEAVFASGQSDIQNKWDADKQAQAAARQIEAEKNERESRKVVQTYENKIADLLEKGRAIRAIPVTGLRISKSICNPRTETTSTSVVDAARADAIELPLTITTSLYSIADDADEQIGLKDAKIKALQDWIISQGFFNYQ